MARFYTPEIIARLMVDSIKTNTNPNSVIDICCGSWNLLKAAKNRWSKVLLSAIDTDKDSANYALSNSSFFNIDGRKFALQALRNNQKYSVVLANPPFASELYNNACIFKKLPGFSDMTHRALTRIETTMFLANLAILDDNGYMVIVLPQTVVNGDWATCLRQYVANNYYLKKIIYLPDNVFGRDISTVILVIESIQKPSKRATRVYTAQLSNKKYKLKYNYSISNNLIQQGYWFPINLVQHHNIDFAIKRGQIGNNVLVASGKNPVIHSTDIANIKNGIRLATRYYPQDVEFKDSFPHAENGDIVMIRVGRNCGLSAIVQTDFPLAISDCIYVIKTQNLCLSDEIFNILTSDYFLDDLPSLTKGVSAKYITKKVLRNYLNAYLDMEGDDWNDYNQAICADP